MSDHRIPQSILLTFGTIATCVAVYAAQEGGKPSSPAETPTITTTPPTASNTLLHYQVIEFKPGSSELSENARKSLRMAVQNARQEGRIDKVHVAVWSDKPYPKSSQDLPEADKRLANQRIEKVEDFLEDGLDVDDVDTYNMAEKSNWLARVFNTQDAELKGLFDPQNDTPLRHDEFLAVRKNAAPSKAVVIVTTEPVNKSESDGL